MNRVLQPDMPMAMFVTCLLAIVDLEHGSMCYSTAGHPPPFHIKKDAAIELGGRGAPLGLFPDRTYQDHTIQIEPGDRLLFYSDGLSEAHNSAGDMFSEIQLTPIIQQANGVELIPFLLQALVDFTGVLSEPEDDVTLVSLERG
jgi:sigma-B regulation protein RsbU (phosphoserine phosphatase)